MYAVEKLFKCLEVVLDHFFSVLQYPIDGTNAATGVSYEKNTSVPFL